MDIEMNQFVDPVLGMERFEQAIRKNLIKTNRGTIHKDLIFFADQPIPGGDYRFTYAIMQNPTKVKGYAVAVNVEPIHGKACLGMGWAVPSKFRRQGTGEQVMRMAIDELRNGFVTKMGPIYLEAVIEPDNQASIKLAEKLGFQFEKDSIDSHSGKPAKAYYLLLE